jgi:hypothetical protein
MVAALMYRGLERNTPGPVGRASNLCTSIQAVNPEIAAIQQHQDPASPGAAEINKAVALELARQIQLVGGDAMEALKSGTFQPGDVTDATGKGNTCKFLSINKVPVSREHFFEDLELEWWRNLLISGIEQVMILMIQ